jgi:hypothetical protein
MPNTHSLSKPQRGFNNPVSPPAHRPAAILGPPTNNSNFNFPLHKNKLPIVVLLSLCLGSSLFANIEITLKDDFINRYKNRATIDASFVVDKAHKHPNRGAADGDLHVAGRADQVGLPIVAEIMNAASQKEAVNKIHAVEGTGEQVPLTGVWRLWCEHGGESQQVQGDPLGPFDTTNPPHVFEIHPTINLDGRSLLESLHKIEKYSKPSQNTQAAFTRYESAPSHIEILQNENAIRLTTSMAGFNYVEFQLHVLGRLFPLDNGDGTAVFAEVHNLDGELLVHKRRMIFVKDSAPEKALKNLKAHQDLHVLAVPRISLDLLAWRRDHHTEEKFKGALDWGLPYEMVIVGNLGVVAVEE